MAIISARRAQTLIDGLNHGDCSGWGRNLKGYVYDIRGLGYVEVNAISRTLVIGETRLKIEKAWRSGSGANLALGLTNGAILVLPIEGR